MTQTNTETQANTDDAKKKNQKGLLLLDHLISLLGVTLSTSSKVLSPAFLNLTQNSILPTLAHIYRNKTPIRIKQWLHILFSPIHQIYALMIQTDQGHDIINEIQNLQNQSWNIFTSANTRQLIIESSGILVKAIDVLSTTQMQTLIKSIPVFMMRVIDLVSSGEMKALVHHMANLVQTSVELLGHEDTTMAIAEITARLVHTLQMERDYYKDSNPNIKISTSTAASGSVSGNHTNRNRMRRRMMLQKRRRRKLKLTPQNNDVNKDLAAIRAKRRRDRNKFMSRTYNDRVILTDFDCDIDIHTDNRTRTQNDILDDTHNADNVAHDRDGEFVSDDDDDDYDDMDIHLDDDSNHNRDVEDAILSSLGDPDNFTTFSGNAWLTTLGRQSHDDNVGVKGKHNNDDDVPSLPSKVILDGVVSGSIGKRGIRENNPSIDSSIHLDDLNLKDSHYDDDEEEENLMDIVVDTSYLRSSIAKRNAKQNNTSTSLIYSKEALKQQDTTTKVTTTCTYECTANGNSCEKEEMVANFDIEDLIMNHDSDSNNDELSSYPCQPQPAGEEQAQNTNNNKNISTKTKKKPIQLKFNTPISNKSIGTETKFVSDDEDQGENNSHSQKQNYPFSKFTKLRRGKESSVAHFYRALEDISTNIRNDTIHEVLKTKKETKSNLKNNNSSSIHNCNVRLSNSKKRRMKHNQTPPKKWYPNAAAAIGAWDEIGFDTLKGLSSTPRTPIRFKAMSRTDDNEEVEEDLEDVNKLTFLYQFVLQGLAMLNTRQKVLLGMFVLVYALACVFFFAFGCYGVYCWIMNRGIFSMIVGHPTAAAPNPNEFIIRIVQEDGINLSQEKVAKNILNLVTKMRKRRGVV
mmetsp:Transcript_6742/g.7319  ORF Transcript_6742/g.7319 Transcript_6742/m.7319 type:complete len:857 (-) Transcript_6742:335-2905(-)